MFFDYEMALNAHKESMESDSRFRAYLVLFSLNYS
jgi:hypothetical protein